MASIRLIFFFSFLPRRTSVRVFLGAYPTMRDAQQRADSALVLIHPLYSPTKPGHNDLALIRLNKPVRLNGERTQHARRARGRRLEAANCREHSLSVPCPQTGCGP